MPTSSSVSQVRTPEPAATGTKTPSGRLPERESVEAASGRGSDRIRKRWGPALSDLEFPGCYSRPMMLAEYEETEGKVEFFDSGEEIARIAKDRGRLRTMSEELVVAAADAADSVGDFFSRLADPDS